MHGGAGSVQHKHWPTSNLRVATLVQQKVEQLGEEKEKMKGTCTNCKGRWQAISHLSPEGARAAKTQMKRRREANADPLAPQETRNEARRRRRCTVGNQNHEGGS